MIDNLYHHCHMSGQDALGSVSVIQCFSEGNIVKMSMGNIQLCLE